MGVPRICSVSNDWKMRTMLSMNTTERAGTITGSVTRIMVRTFEAPDTLAASSMLRSMLRKAGVRSMTFWEMALAIRCAQMIPGTE